MFWYHMVLVPFAPKKVLLTFFYAWFTYEWNLRSLQVLRNKSLFKKDQYPSLSVSNIHYFWTLSLHHGGFWVTLSHPVTNFKKTVSPPKACLDAALCIICLLQCFLTSKGHYILLATAKIACPIKGMQALVKNTSSGKSIHPLKAVLFYDTVTPSNRIVLICKHCHRVSASHKDCWEKRVRAIDFADLLRDLPIFAWWHAICPW